MRRKPMAKSKEVFICQNCGVSSPKWQGQCALKRVDEFQHNAAVSGLRDLLQGLRHLPHGWPPVHSDYCSVTYLCGVALPGVTSSPVRRRAQRVASKYIFWICGLSHASGAWPKVE